MIRRLAALAAVIPVMAAFSFANTAPVAAAAGELSPVMVVLDSSGSMTAKDAGGGVSRMDAAKRAVGSMVDALPAQAQVGLAIYGANTGSGGADKAAGCRDVRVVQPVGPVDKAGIKRAANATQARGYTPIGQALRTAAARLPREGQRSIVLVSDGEDTCAPPQPCQVAEELSGQGVDLRIHAIGFRVNAKARAQLACIAQRTGGTYHDAADAVSLTGVLGRVTERALRHYDPTGKPVAGTPDQASAPVLAPGQYLDTLNGVEERFYAADLAAGDTAYFAATAIFPRGNPNSLETLDIRFTGPGGADCYQSERKMNTRATDGGTVTTLVTWRMSGSGRAECKVPGRYAFRITRLHGPNQGGTDRVPVELLLRVEPPLAGGQGEPAQTNSVGFAAEPTGPARPVRGGGSFNEATPLPAAGRFGETIHYGEELFYRVRLDWGRGLAYRIVLAGRPDGKTTNIRTSLFSPVRSELEYDSSVYTGNSVTLPTDGKPIATPRVTYLNRNANNSDFRKASVDGWYYLVVKLGLPSTEVPSAGVPLTIDLAIAGEKATGPDYGVSGQAVGPTPTPTPTPTQALTQGPSPDPSPGPSATGQAAGAPGGTADPDGSDSNLPWLIGGAAALVLAGAIVAAALILRRKNPHTPAAPPGQDWTQRPGPGQR
jgi:Ca-activated chloride channel family protein